MAILAPGKADGASLSAISEKVFAGERISPEEALLLLEKASPAELSALATERRRQRRPDNVVGYVVGRILNYTNVCWVRCRFCAFYRVPNHAEGYLLSDEEILEKVRNTVEVAGKVEGRRSKVERAELSPITHHTSQNPKSPEGTPGLCRSKIQNLPKGLRDSVGAKSKIDLRPSAFDLPTESVEILFQGGLNPKLKIDYYENIFKKIKKAFPQVILHALSPAEIIYIAHISRLTLRDCLQRLKDAGLHSIPGAGGEILVDRVRKIIAPYKDTTEEWLECMRTAASLGIRSTASMMFGHVETLEDRVEHLTRIRDLQDECQPFRAFITWSFQPEDTQLPIAHKASGWDYLRTLAVSRIFLDNIDNLQVSFLTQGPKIAQLGLAYGANDFGSIMIEENVVSAKGNKFIVSSQEFERLVSDAGYEPRRRNTRYELL